MFQPGYVTSTGYYEPAKALVDGAMVGAVAGVPVVKHVTEIPNFISILATAGGQMFFSLSLGMGIMITYGSYLDKKENLQKNALLIIIMDTLVALMAGLCVIPGRFALDPTGNLGGPKLLFITMQNVFNSMGTVGYVFGIIFYLLVILAAVSSSISLLEAVVAHFVDKARDEGKGDKRKLYSLIGAIGAGILCVIVRDDHSAHMPVNRLLVFAHQLTETAVGVPAYEVDYFFVVSCHDVLCLGLFLGAALDIALCFPAPIYGGSSDVNISRRSNDASCNDGVSCISCDASCKDKV